MQKEPNKKNRLYITIFSILFFGSLLFAIYKAYGPFQLTAEVSEPQKEIPEYFDYGTVVDSIYCNDFFRFQMPTFKGYTTNYKKYDYIEKNFYERDSILAKPRLTSDIYDLDLLVIEPELIKIDFVNILQKHKKDFVKILKAYSTEKYKRESFGSDYQLVIRAHKLSEEYLGSYISLFENLHNPNYGNSKTKMISNISFREYHGMESQGSSVQETMFGLMGGKNRNIISYFTQIHNFALSIDLFYKTEEQKCILLEMVDTIEFN